MSKCNGIDVYYNGKLIIVGFSSGFFSSIFTPVFYPVLLYSVVIQIADESKSQ